MSKNNLLSIFICLFFTSFFVCLFQGFKYIFHNTATYDYESIVSNEKYDWTGPKIGQRIALDKLTDVDGILLSQNSRNSLTVISVIDPECGACKGAKDQMQFIQNSLVDNEIEYCVVSFSTKISSEELVEFSRTLDLSAKSYIWAGNKAEILPEINKMVIPTHILVDSQGFVLKSFPGTDRDEDIRSQMSERIIEEVLKEKSKLNAKK